jgi:hypothetical protein
MLKIFTQLKTVLYIRMGVDRRIWIKQAKNATKSDGINVVRYRYSIKSHLVHRNTGIITHIFTYMFDQLKISVAGPGQNQII